MKDLMFSVYVALDTGINSTLDDTLVKTDTIAEVKRIFDVVKNYFTGCTISPVFGMFTNDSDETTYECSYRIDILARSYYNLVSFDASMTYEESIRVTLEDMCADLKQAFKQEAIIVVEYTGNFSHV